MLCTGFAVAMASLRSLQQQGQQQRQHGWITLLQRQLQRQLQHMSPITRITTKANTWKTKKSAWKTTSIFNTSLC